MPAPTFRLTLEKENNRWRAFIQKFETEKPRTAPDDDDVVLRYYNLLVFNFQTCEEFTFYIGIPTEIYNELICFLDIKRRLLFLSTIF